LLGFRELPSNSSVRVIVGTHPNGVPDISRG
jgi:hypothetical protein